MTLRDMSDDQLRTLKGEFLNRYNEFKERNLKLDMSRGKPSSDQLDLTNGMLCTLCYKDYLNENSLDCRNYGISDGLPEMKKIFSDIFEVPIENVIVGGNSSLNLMFDCISQGMATGFGNGPWAAEEDIKFLCPAPGYDRHFGITEYFGFKLILVDMTPDGPNMDQIEEYIKDPSVKGVWCVPKYSNPTGITYSDDVVKRFSKLKPAASDFRIFWDNSYVVHDLNEIHDKLLNLFDLCCKNGSEDLVLMFTSTSKISFPGAGVAAMAASKKNLELIRGRINYQTIGPDKLNQLRHIKFFKDKDGILNHMKHHAELISPKFKVVLDKLEKELAPLNCVEWTNPNGGYFISVDLPDGCAKRTVELCKAAGLVITPEGATFPYGIDPRDRNIRISPTYPPINELSLAMELFCVAVKIAIIEKYIKNI